MSTPRRTVTKGALRATAVSIDPLCLTCSWGRVQLFSRAACGGPRSIDVEVLRYASYDRKDMLMRSTPTRLALGFSVLAAIVGLSTFAADTARAAPALTGPATAKQVAFQNAMRMLWEDHITWTRLYIVDFAASLPEADTTAQRLLKNQVDIGDAIKPYYGAAAGDKLTDLLKQHILGAVDLLTAAKAGDSAKVDAASKRWYANGGEIAAFLSSANPQFWPLAEMQAMMKEHLDHTLAEAVAHLTGDWAADVAAYDVVHRQILEMADMLSAGIISQFPGQFDRPVLQSGSESPRNVIGRLSG